MQKVTNKEILRQLLLAKAMSDKKDYTSKYNIMQKMITENPGDFIIDQEDPNFPGITHVPTGFRMHLPKQLTTRLNGVDKQASFKLNPSNADKLYDAFREAYIHAILPSYFVKQSASEKDGTPDKMNLVTAALMGDPTGLTAAIHGYRHVTKSSAINGTEMDLNASKSPVEGVKEDSRYETITRPLKSPLSGFTTNLKGKIAEPDRRFNLINGDWKLNKYANYKFLHRSKGSYNLLKPITYDELKLSRADELNDIELKEYIQYRKKFENELRRRLGKKSIPSEKDNTFLYGTIAGYEKMTPFGNTYTGELTPEIINSSFFDVIGDGKSRTLIGEKGLQQAIKRWNNAKELKTSKYLEMDIEPRIEVITQSKIKPEEILSKESSNTMNPIFLIPTLLIKAAKDKYNLYYFEGRNTGIAARSEEEARSKKKRGGDELVAVREPTESENKLMEQGKWVRTRYDGKPPGKSEVEGPGMGPPLKKKSKDIMAAINMQKYLEHADTKRILSQVDSTDFTQHSPFIEKSAVLGFKALTGYTGPIKALLKDLKSKNIPITRVKPETIQARKPLTDHLPTGESGYSRGSWNDNINGFRGAELLVQKGLPRTNYGFRQLPDGTFQVNHTAGIRGGTNPSPIASLLHEAGHDMHYRVTRKIGIGDKDLGRYNTGSRHADDLLKEIGANNAALQFLSRHNATPEAMAYYKGARIPSFKTYMDQVPTDYSHTIVNKVRNLAPNGYTKDLSMRSLLH